MRVEPSFWRGTRVLVTGHTGFKGSWLSLWLQDMGAEVTGLSIDVPTEPSLHVAVGAPDAGAETWTDVRDGEAVRQVLAAARPQIVIHMAAQALVRRSLRDPRETYATNVLGTVNVLEAVREVPGVRVVVNVTSDKCYENREHGRPFREDDAMGGEDPYSSSKGCAELVAHAYQRSFFDAGGEAPRVGSARAGNVIGGGDWGEDRLVPDIMRAVLADDRVPIRNPDAVRPWQHVLNPVSGYLLLAQALWEDASRAGGWNFGPDPGDARPVRHVVERVSELWPGEVRWEVDGAEHPREAHTLLLDSAKARAELGWAPGWDLDAGLKATVVWYAALAAGAPMRAVTLDQIREFAETSA